MADAVAKRIDEMGTTFGGAFKKARAELGVTSFGIAVIDMPPGSGDRYPEHDHRGDGQEEVYVALRGSGVVVVDGGEELPLDPGTMVRVGPSARRRLRPGPDGLRVLALGGVPGAAYDPPDFTQLDSLPLAAPAPVDGR